MIINFRNTFRITKFSKRQIFDVIISELKAIEVDSIETKENEVIYKYKFWKLASYSQMLSKAHKGNFKLIEQSKDTIEIIYESSVFFILDIICIPSLFIVGVLFSAIYIYLSIFLIIQIFIKINSVKKGNKSLINKIISHFTE